MRRPGEILVEAAARCDIGGAAINVQFQEKGFDGGDSVRGDLGALHGEGYGWWGGGVSDFEKVIAGGEEGLEHAEVGLWNWGLDGGCEIGGELGTLLWA